jgi:hypothetical protein
MLVENRDRGLGVDADVRKARRGEERARPIVERPTQPRCQRHRQTALPAVDERRRQMAPREALEEDLGREAADALVGRQPCGEAHDVEVEKRRAQLEGAAHPRAVGLGEQAFGEGGLEVASLHDVQDVPVARVLR